MKKIIVIMLTVILTTSALFAQTRQNEDEQIKDVIARFSKMWTDANGSSIANQITATNFVYITPQGNSNRQQFLEFVKSINTNHQIRKHNHEVYKIVTQGNLGFEYGKITFTLDDETVQISETLNVFVKEDKVWKIITNMPVNIVKDVLKL